MVPIESKIVFISMPDYFHSIVDNQILSSKNFTCFTIIAIWVEMKMCMYLVTSKLHHTHKDSVLCNLRCGIHLLMVHQLVISYNMSLGCLLVPDQPFYLLLSWHWEKCLKLTVQVCIDNLCLKHLNEDRHINNIPHASVGPILAINATWPCRSNTTYAT